MKHITLALLIGCLTFLSGCFSTDLVAVDKFTARKQGIPIMSFDDNPFFAYIRYDASKIPNFDESKVKVYLRRSYKDFPPSSFEALFITRMSVEGNPEWTRLTLPSYANALPAFYRKKKDVTILHREPGYLKILAIDDIGTYVVTYGE